MHDTSDEVAVVGAGWAGCAAAVTLAGRGHRIALFEAGATLGGRARRVVRDGLGLDNGAHLVLGAYRETLRLIAAVHKPGVLPQLLDRRPLSLQPACATQEGHVSLEARALPAPFGVLAGLLAARGLSLVERAGVAAWFARLAFRRFRCPPGQTVALMLASSPPEAARRLWEPLCLAALNTPPERACAQTFANVLAAAFSRRASDADLLLAHTDLSALFPEAAAAHVAANGGTIHLRRSVLVNAIAPDRVTLQDRDGIRTVRGAVIAVAPHQLAPAFAPHARLAWPALDAALSSTAALRYEPITTVWLGYANRIVLPAPLVRLDDAPGHWAFERSDVLVRTPGSGVANSLNQLFGVVISAHGPHESLEREQLARAVDAQLRRLWPSLPPCAWHQVIRERRATYACTPDRPRLASGELHPRLVLAGDYLDTQFPATLEAAVRSGIEAATALDRNLRDFR